MTEQGAPAAVAPTRVWGVSVGGWMALSDALAALTVISVPWSTSGVAIFAVLWAFSLIPTFDRATAMRIVCHPAAWVALAWPLLGLVGTLWADVPWRESAADIDPMAKFLLLPLLLYHFARSERALLVTAAFVAACAVLMVYSWLIYFAPALAWVPPNSPGIPLKDYINQSQEFVLSAFLALGGAWRLWRQQRRGTALALIALAAGFLINVLFVAVARTALVYIPVLVLLFALWHVGRAAAAGIVTGFVVVAAVVWLASPHLRERVHAVTTEYELYRSENAVTSTGRRIEYWRKSVRFIADAPWIGHGTGSTEQLFMKAARGQTGVAAEVIENPHNQILNVAIQFGVLGAGLLLAFWGVHLALFRGASFAAWAGLTVVVQNIVSSLFNSHLFDFHEGWMYVLGVGIAGGVVNRFTQH